MEKSTSKGMTLYFFLAYLITLGAALYFSKGIKSLHPSYQLVLILGLGGLALGEAFSLLGGKGARGCLAMVVFQVIQGGLGFALSRYYFNLPLQESFVFPAGAAAALLIHWIVSLDLKASLRTIGFALFAAGGLVVGLRLGGVWGGLLWGLAFLSGQRLGGRSFLDSEERSVLWSTGLFFTAVLTIGRAAIQYYLLESSYASLGVVITHPYTFVALFAGLILPLALWLVDRDRALHPVISFLLLGLVLPFALGVFIHVRPMAGYLLGLVSSTFVVGIFLSAPAWVGFLSFLNLGVVVFSLPLFKELATLSRIDRMKILGVLFVLAVIAYLFSKLLSRKREAPQAA